MFGFIASKPVLDEEAVTWLYAAYAWALKHFGSDIFFEETELVTPTDKHFPDKADNAVHAAGLMFERMKGYAAMQNWPFRLAPLGNEVELDAGFRWSFNGVPRGPHCQVEVSGNAKGIKLVYDPGEIRAAEKLIAGFAFELANYLVHTAPELPPGGEEYRGPATDLLAIFMGFGLFFTNNAVTGGCSGCGGSIKRLGHLTEDEMTYAFAIFCVLQGLSYDKVKPHLKSVLRPLFKKAIKEIGSNQEAINRLRNIDAPLKVASKAAS